MQGTQNIQTKAKEFSYKRSAETCALHWQSRTVVYWIIHLIGKQVQPIAHT